MSKKRNRRKERALTARTAQTSPTDVCRTISDVYLLFILCVFPLVIGTGDYGYSNIVDVKAWIWLTVTGLWALCLVFVIVRGRVKKQKLDVSFGWVQRMAAAFVAVTVLSALLSDRRSACLLQMNPSNTNSALFIGSYAAAFLGLSCFGRLRRRHIWALGVSALLAGVLGAVQLAGYNPLTMYPEGLNYFNKHREYVGAFLGTMGNVDHLAAYLCFTIPLLTVYALRSADRRDKLLLLPALLSLYILYAVDVDAGKVGLAGCVVIALPVALKNPRAVRWACAGCVAAVLLGLAAVWFWPGRHGFIYEASQILHGHAEPFYGHDRVGIWQLAWTYVRQRPIFGSGPGSGAWLLQSIRALNEQMGRTTITYNVHNTYLGYLMEGGLLSLSCYLAIIARAVYGWIAGRRDNGIAALGAGVICYLIQDFFSLNLVVTAPLLWAGLGLLAGNAASGIFPEKTHREK